MCSVQDGIYTVGKDHTCSNPYLRSLPSVAIETVPVFVTDDGHLLSVPGRSSSDSAFHASVTLW